MHLASSVGRVGAVVAYLVLAFAVPVSGEPETMLAAWVGMELIGWYAVVPLAGATL